MGGDAQTQVHCQLLVGLVERGHAHARALADLGHATVAVRRYEEAMGHAQIILRDPQTGGLCGAADPRSDGTALGF